MKRLIFDISTLCGTNNIRGIPRFTIEVLQRLVKRDLDIILICSDHFEEDRLRNCYDMLGQTNIPFQSKNVEHYTLPPFSPSEKQSKPLFGFMEELVRKIIPDSDWLDTMIENARMVKRKFIPPLSTKTNDSVKHQRSPLLEHLIRNSDAYFSPYAAIVQEIDANPSENYKSSTI
ncbi:MAG: hypothetical protein LBJ00_07295 [Planctomycetaceae bacterium]|nr:hypothetical protein [Planctomycetaceae bacterium]